MNMFGILRREHLPTQLMKSLTLLLSLTTLLFGSLALQGQTAPSEAPAYAPPAAPTTLPDPSFLDFGAPVRPVFDFTPTVTSSVEVEDLSSLEFEVDLIPEPSSLQLAMLALPLFFLLRRKR